MIVTEEEAKTKRCQESYPAAHDISTDGHTELVPIPPDAISYNSSGGFQRRTAPLNCIGSACMAWRWKRISNANDYSANDTFSTKSGFCGKAGHP